ncbi:MAG: cytochrome c oxidase assembly protein [Rhodospirillaceae bacterium]|nr:cytochrome c oxidase assembly protein [Rhodospirillaceae bacterium]|tara:strand:- start:159 stop:755 length:597 start_codon:yes stop_codon:yes gene_type:complete
MKSTLDSKNNSNKLSKNVVAGLAASLVICMAALSYASVPLYKLFCQVTGYGGTTQVATNLPSTRVDRDITVRFDANVNPALDWKFTPTQNAMKLSPGQSALAFFRVENMGSEPVVGTATFNVTPDKAGLYFNKIECFCFQEQILEPDQSMDMPVSFFIDPELTQDPNLDDVTTITLSYTFFKAGDQSGSKKADKKNAS